MYKPGIKTETRSPVPDHEVHLAFMNDDDAINFIVWWDEEGWELFKASLQTES
jgi:hypothetical protein